MNDSRAPAWHAQGSEFNPNHLKKGEKERDRSFRYLARRLQPACGQRSQGSQARQKVSSDV